MVACLSKARNHGLKIEMQKEYFMLIFNVIHFSFSFRRKRLIFRSNHRPPPAGQVRKCSVSSHREPCLTHLREDCDGEPDNFENYMKHQQLQQQLQNQQLQLQHQAQCLYSRAGAGGAVQGECPESPYTHTCDHPVQLVATADAPDVTDVSKLAGIHRSHSFSSNGGYASRADLCSVQDCGRPIGESVPMVECTLPRTLVRTNSGKSTGRKPIPVDTPRYFVLEQQPSWRQDSSSATQPKTSLWSLNEVVKSIPSHGSFFLGQCNCFLHSNIVLQLSVFFISFSCTGLRQHVFAFALFPKTRQFWGELQFHELCEHLAPKNILLPMGKREKLCCWFFFHSKSQISNCTQTKTLVWLCSCRTALQERNVELVADWHRSIEKQNRVALPGYPWHHLMAMPPGFWRFESMLGETLRQCWGLEADSKVTTQALPKIHGFVWSILIFSQWFLHLVKEEHVLWLL